jgi:hypothetical protein
MDRSSICNIGIDPDTPDSIDPLVTGHIRDEAYEGRATLPGNIQIPVREPQKLNLVSRTQRICQSGLLEPSGNT